MAAVTVVTVAVPATAAAAARRDSSKVSSAKMNKRRDLLKSIAAGSVLCAAYPASARAEGGDPSRIALVIGNNRYRQSPLVNAANDATAVAELFGRAKFDVTRHIDIGHAEFSAAIAKFGRDVARSEVKLAIFYYAGHGAQVNWTNYLLPVDANVRSSADLEAHCISLGTLLGPVGKTKDKVFLVILDACRDNPFGDSYALQRKGLSQFDARVGSLLAYATAPDSVAADGEGQHGLYTENILKEFSVPGVRVEDAFKRVRLNVRLASNGRQIPWESTSLENDVFLFPSSRAKVSEAELERELEEELASWSHLRKSKNADDWIGYLRHYPNGRFSEIAQDRLNRLLIASAPQPPALTHLAAQQIKGLDTAPTELKAPELPKPPALAHLSTQPLEMKSLAPAPTEMKPSALPEPPTLPRLATQPLEITALAPAPKLWTPSANPNSAGTHPLGRIYTDGDETTYRESDLLTGLALRTFKLRVTRVDSDSDRVEFNDAEWITDLMGNPQKIENFVYEQPVQLFPSELQIGNRWIAHTRFRQSNGQWDDRDLTLRVTGVERIKVPAGEFDTFKIEGRGWWRSGSLTEATYWVIPGMNAFYVKREFLSSRPCSAGRCYLRSERHELVAHRQNG
jgi:uncharacterized caspase-like protein